MDMYYLSSSPHIRHTDTTRSIMTDVCIAMVPMSIFAVWHFGWKALFLLLVAVAFAWLTEYIWQNLMGIPGTWDDMSAVVTGMILALNLPVSVPLWMAALGSVFAILVVKQLFGGVGQNFMNPALAARCFLLISFAGPMTTFTLDGVATATPLTVMKTGGEVSVASLFTGMIPGTLGEVSVLCILAGAVYLVVRKIITLRIPLTYIGSFLLMIIFFGGKGFDPTFLLAHLFGGGLLFGAFFMATDYSTTPVTALGQIYFGIFLGVMTAIFRLFGATAEGVSYAIILGNIIAPILERKTLPVAFGRKGEKYAKE